MKYALSILTPMAALALMTSPASATAGVPIDFSFTASELATEKSRAEMLARMKNTAKAACAGKQSSAYFSQKACQADLEQQFLTAIESQKLALEKERPSKLIARAGN